MHCLKACALLFGYQIKNDACSSGWIRIQVNFYVKDTNVILPVKVSLWKRRDMKIYT